MKRYLSYLLNFAIVALLAYHVGRYIYFLPKYSKGEAAPDFSTTLLNGQQFKLSDLRGHYVLLDFWGSWCGPCRRNHPELVAFYEKHKSVDWKDAAGLEIVSIGIETQERRWKAAIEQDGLSWTHHISELNYFDGEIAKKYGVRQIPTKFLINPKGEIIGVNLSFGKIEKLLAVER